MSLDQVTLSQVLSGIGSGQTAQLAQCTHFLETVRGHPDFFRFLITLSNSLDASPSVRIQASIRLKNEIKDRWVLGPASPLPPISLEDRNLVKANIVDAIIHNLSHKPICQMYKEMLHQIIISDYPEAWPNLLETVISKMKGAGDVPTLYGTLQAVKILFLKYEAEVSEKREPFETIICYVFPFMEHLACMQIKNYNSDSPVILNLLLKIFYSSLTFKLPNYLRKDTIIQAWMTIVKGVIDKSLAPELMEVPNTDEHLIQLEKNFEWKNKKIAGRIIQKFFQIHTNPKQSGVQPADFCAFWTGNFGLPFLESFFKWLQTSVVGQFVSPSFSFSCCCSIFYALDNPDLMKVLLPILETLLIDMLIPQLCVSKKEDDLFNTNGEEFIRREEDRTSDISKARTAAVDLIQKICDKAGPDNENYTFKFMNFCAYCFENQVNPRTGGPVDLRYKDALLIAYGQLASKVRSYPLIYEKTEYILTKFIIPEMGSAVAFLRARACWVFGIYGAIEFKDMNALKMASEGLLGCLNCTSLPIAIKAGLALDTLLEHEECVKALTPMLGSILEAYLKIANTIEHEGTLKALSSIIEKFGDAVGPFALQLTEHLCGVFFNYAKPKKEDDSDGLEEDEMRPDDCLATIRMIMMAKLQKDIYGQIFMRLVDVLDYCLMDESKELIEDILPCLNLVIYHSPVITEDMWFYYSIICYVVAGAPSKQFTFDVTKLPEQKVKILEGTINAWGSRHIDIVLGCFQNYIAKGGEIFLNGKDIYGMPLLENLFRVVQKVYSDGMTSDKDFLMICATRLLIVLIENHCGKIDLLVPKIIERLVELLGFPRSRDFRSVILQALCMCWWYNPRIAMGHLIQCNTLGPVLTAMLSDTSIYDSMIAKERLLIFICALLSLPPAEFPANIIPLGSLIKETLILTTRLLEMREEDSECNEDNEAIEAEKDGEEKPWDGTGTPVFDDPAKYKNKGREEDLDIEDEDDISSEKEEYIWSSESGLIYDSPFEKIDAIINLKNILIEIQSSIPDYFGMIMSFLDTTEQASLGKNFEKAQEQWNDK